MSVDTHARLDWIEHSDGQLLIGGCRLEQLVERVGTTPFYAYDRQLIRARVATLRNALPRQIKLHYAIKANPMVEVIDMLAGIVDGFDVASHLEMLAALNSGIGATSIGFAGPGKSLVELRAAISAGICISVESERELMRIAQLSKELDCAPMVSLRVNPEFELKRAGAKMGGHPSQFGIDATDIENAVATARRSGIEVTGLHIYAGSQNLDADSIIEANRLTLELGVELATKASLALRQINIGGGYGIPYFPNENALDLLRVSEALANSLSQHERDLGSVDIIVELGRYIVGEAGYYVTRISDIKNSQGKTFAVVDGGLHHHLANSGNFGQVLRKNYPVLIANKIGAANSKNPISIVGPLCTPLDIVASSVFLPEVSVGDFVVVFQSGAYACSASPHQFLGHRSPAEILVGPRS